MKPDKDLYGKLMHYRPRKIYQTYNTINRSYNILYMLCETELHRIQKRFGWHLTLKIVNESFITCTKYNNGKYSVTVTPKTNDGNGRGEITTITGNRAKIIYDRVKQYCK